MPRNSPDPKPALDSKSTVPDSKSTSGRFAYEGLERVIHEKARLSILASLAAHADGVLFTELKTLCSLTDGNLSRQIQFLQESGFVEVWKGYANNRPLTVCRLTPQGRQRFLEYVSVLERIVRDAHKQKKSESRQSDLSGIAPAL